MALREQPVDERLQVGARDRVDPPRAERWQDAEAKRLVVAADRAGLVLVARAVANRARAGAGEPGLGGVCDGEGSGGAARAEPDLSHRVAAPRLGFGERPAVLPDLSAV